MPCRDDYPPTREEILNASVPAPMLCALLRALPGPAIATVMEKIDWKAAGITRAEFDEWWRLHLDRDRKRRAREVLEAAEAAARKKAVSKLTAKERRLLGLK